MSYGCYSAKVLYLPAIYGWYSEFFVTMGLEGNSRVCLLDNRHVIIRLELEEDYSGLGRHVMFMVEACAFSSGHLSFAELYLLCMCERFSHICLFIIFTTNMLCFFIASAVSKTFVSIMPLPQAVGLLLLRF